MVDSRPNVGHSFKLTHPPPGPKYPNSRNHHNFKVTKLELSNIVLFIKKQDRNRVLQIYWKKKLK